MAASGTSPDQGFNGSKNLQKKQHFVGVSRVLGMHVQDFLPEVYLFHLPLLKGGTLTKFDGIVK